MPRRGLRSASPVLSKISDKPAPLTPAGTHSQVVAPLPCCSQGSGFLPPFTWKGWAEGGGVGLWSCYFIAKQSLRLNEKEPVLSTSGRWPRAGVREGGWGGEVVRGRKALAVLSSPGGLTAILAPAGWCIMPSQGQVSEVI